MLRSFVGTLGVVAVLTLAMTRFSTAADATPESTSESPASPASNEVQKSKPDNDETKEEDKGKSVPKRYRGPPPIHDFGEDEEEYAVV